MARLCMDNSSSSSPEHDEKTGSFAPRTMGANETTKKAKRQIPWRKLAPGGAVVTIILVLTYVFWWAPRRESQLNPQHPTSFFFAAVSSLNEEEVTNGQGTAAEPPLEKRVVAEREIKAALERFPDIQAIVAPCVLTGHDVHVVDPSGRILTHFMADEDIPAPMSEVRDAFEKLPGEEEFIILIRNKKPVAYTLEGELFVP
jgi:hypothetical protein